MCKAVFFASGQNGQSSEHLFLLSRCSKYTSTSIFLKFIAKTGLFEKHMYYLKMYFHVFSDRNMEDFLASHVNLPEFCWTPWTLKNSAVDRL